MALTEISSKESTSYNAATKTDYVYLTTIYWDDELNKRVSKRKVIGKIDPVTGQKVNTGSVGRPRAKRDDAGNPRPDYQKLYEELLAQKQELPSAGVLSSEDTKTLTRIQAELTAMTSQIQSIRSDIQKLLENR